MRRFTGPLVGAFARVMAAGWLFQAVFPTLCCCCCIVGGNANANADTEVFYPTASCCCQMLFRQPRIGDHDTASRAAAEHRAGCTTCESCGCCHGSDGRQSTLRRRQLEGSQRVIAKLVLPCLDIPSDRDSQWPSPTLADACDKGTALSAAERCISLQRLLL